MQVCYGSVRQGSVGCLLNSDRKEESMQAEQKFELIAVAIILGIVSPIAMSADMVHGGDPSQMELWQGRAGGLVHSGRVSHLRVPAAGVEVGVTYDKEVAQRTNMPRQDDDPQILAVSYDKEVAERTNMPRSEKDTLSAQAAAQQ